MYYVSHFLAPTAGILAEETGMDASARIGTSTLATHDCQAGKCLRSSVADRTGDLDSSSALFLFALRLSFLGLRIGKGV